MSMYFKYFLQIFITTQSIYRIIIFIATNNFYILYFLNIYHFHFYTIKIYQKNQDIFINSAKLLFIKSDNYENCKKTPSRTERNERV